MKRFTSQKFLLLISSFCLLLFLVSCDVLTDELTSDTETDSAIIDSVADTTAEITTMLDPSVSETEEVPTEEEITEEPSYEGTTCEPTVDTSEEPTDEATTASAETSSKETTEEITEEITEETTEEPTEPVTYEDEFVNAVISELPADMRDMEKSLHEFTYNIEFSYSISTSPRILSPGDTLEITVNELYYYFELQDMEYYCTEFLAYDKPEAEWDHWDHLNIFLHIRKADYTSVDMSPSTEDYVHWYLTIPEDAEPGAYEISVRIYDEIPSLCYFIVH